MGGAPQSARRVRLSVAWEDARVRYGSSNDQASLIRQFAAAIALLTSLLLGVGTAVAQDYPDVYHPASEDHPTSGKQDFMKHCAPCHGANGRGHGPEVNVIPDLHPPDLTALSLKNGGIFPAKQVADTVDGRKSIPSHKRFDMPFWGVNFQQEGKEFSPESEARAKARIDALVDYIRTIQRQ